MQAANRVSNGVSKKVAGTIGGGCLFTGVLCGILGGACLAKSFNSDAAKFFSLRGTDEQDLSDLYTDLDSIFTTKDSIDVNVKYYIISIFSKKTQNMINSYKDALVGYFGIKAYFVGDFYKRCCINIYKTTKISEEDSNDKKQAEELAKAYKSIEDLTSKQVSVILEIFKAYDACLSTFTEEELKKLRDEKLVDDPLVQKLMNSSTNGDSLLKKLYEACNTFNKIKEDLDKKYKMGFSDET